MNYVLIGFSVIVLDVVFDRLSLLVIFSLALFGSTVRGEARLDSDVDLLVEFDGPVDLFAFCDVENFLSEQFGHNVDLVQCDSVKPFMSERILSKAVRVF